MARNILIVDSDINFSVPIKRALEATGSYHVRTVTRLSSASDALDENEFELAIVDARLEFSTPAQVVKAIRDRQPKLPIILSSMLEDDEKQLPSLGVQRFVLKPYNARTLIPLLESAATEQITPVGAGGDTHAHLAELESREKEALIGPLLEATRQSVGVAIAEPPHTRDDSTIAEVLEMAINPSVTRRIMDYIQYETPPEVEQTERAGEIEVAPEPESADILPASAQDLPASAALSTTLGTTSLDTLLDEIRSYASGKPSEPEVPYDPISELMAQLETPSLDTSARIEPLPSNEETRLNFIPPPPRLPDQEWLDSAEDEATVKAPAPEPENPPDEALFPVTVEEITQQLEAVEDEEMEEAFEKEVEARRLPDHVLAHYALQLTQFSMESSSLGAAITRESQRLAEAGNLSQEDWQTILAMINESWDQAGDSRTRVLYRQLARGEVLIYSILTIDDLTLTLVFAAETPLKVIRRQAVRLTESLRTVALPTEAMVYAEPSQPSQESEEPPADREAPPPSVEERREGSVAPLVAPLEFAPQEASAPPLPAEAPPGTYAAYACVWIIENKRDAINPAAAQMIESWLREICSSHQWTVETIQIEREWLSVAVRVPTSSLPNDIAAVLMDETAARALALDPSSSKQSPWAKAYLIRTPPSSLAPQEIDRFVNFYRSTQMSA